MAIRQGLTTTGLWRVLVKANLMATSGAAMRVIDLALKDLLQIVQDWKSALFLVIMLILFTLFFGLVFGSGEEGDPHLPVGFVDHDQAGALSTNLQNLLEASDAVRPVLLEGAGQIVRPSLS